MKEVLKIGDYVAVWSKSDKVMLYGTVRYGTITETYPGVYSRPNRPIKFERAKAKGAGSVRVRFNGQRATAKGSWFAVSSVELATATVIR